MAASVAVVIYVVVVVVIVVVPVAVVVVVFVVVDVIVCRKKLGFSRIESFEYLFQEFLGDAFFLFSIKLKKSKFDTAKAGRVAKTNTSQVGPWVKKVYCGHAFLCSMYR